MINYLIGGKAMFRLVQALIVIAFLLGGCQMSNEELLPKDMNPADLPEGRAFEDEFTRSFLQSTEEIMPGYYPFLSMNGKYTMGFPREGLTSKIAYPSRENQESLSVTIWEANSDIVGHMKVNYYGFLNPGFEESKLSTLETIIENKLKFEQIQEEGQTLYVSFFQEKEVPDDFEESYGYAGYLQNNKGAEGIYLIYTSSCKANCEELKEADLKQAYEWMKSVKFIPHDNHE